VQVSIGFVYPQIVQSGFNFGKAGKSFTQSKLVSCHCMQVCLDLSQVTTTWLSFQSVVQGMVQGVVQGVVHMSVVIASFWFHTPPVGVNSLLVAAAATNFRWQ